MGGGEALAVTFDGLLPKTLEQLKMLNAVIFPIKYKVKRPPPPPFSIQGVSHRPTNLFMPLLFLPHAPCLAGPRDRHHHHWHYRSVLSAAMNAAGSILLQCSLQRMKVVGLMRAGPARAQDGFYRECCASGDVTQLGAPPPLPPLPLLPSAQTPACPPAHPRKCASPGKQAVMPAGVRGIRNLSRVILAERS